MIYATKKFLRKVVYNEMLKISKPHLAYKPIYRYTKTTNHLILDIIGLTILSNDFKINYSR
jgi:hypothetical protein